MKRSECRVGMVVYTRTLAQVKAIVIKCNPKNAKVKIIESCLGYEAGHQWSISYDLLDPVFGENLDAEIMMKSFECPENSGIKTYFSNREYTDLPELLEGSPEFHIMNAICELWRRLSDDNLERECQKAIEKEELLPTKRRPATIMRDIQTHYSSMINSLFSAIGREVSKSEAESWEKNRMEKPVSYSVMGTKEAFGN